MEESEVDEEETLSPDFSNKQAALRGSSRLEASPEPKPVDKRPVDAGILKKHSSYDTGSPELKFAQMKARSLLVSKKSESSQGRASVNMPLISVHMHKKVSFKVPQHDSFKNLLGKQSLLEFEQQSNSQTPQEEQDEEPRQTLAEMLQANLKVLKPVPEPEKKDHKSEL